MRYEGKIYRPPSEANSYILQATIGCSWNRCTYCDMYREKQYRQRDMAQVLEDIELAGSTHAHYEKVFVADGDALIMDLASWTQILQALKAAFPSLRRVSCYAMASNILEKSEAELAELKKQGLDLLYIGPESGDDQTLKRIAKGSTAAEHVTAAQKAKAAGMAMSVIFLLGAGGTERSSEHAAASAELASAMNPEYLAALTLSVIPDTPMARMVQKRKFELPDAMTLLQELRIFVSAAAPRDSLFRTNHASNYLAIGGRLPRDRQGIVDTIDQALAGDIALRPDYFRGL